MKKLWDKGLNVDKFIEEFTVGKDRELDIFLARWDVLGSMAHVIMLNEIKLITDTELASLKNELKLILKTVDKGAFIIEDGIEDVHSQVELLLTRKLGDAGKKIHSGRSRNDQVLLDLKLFFRQEIKEITELADNLNKLWLQQSEEYKEVLLPGYTHLQIAMPSSFGLWFGAWAECLADDLQMLLSAYKIADQNPLGSAAGYGSSFPLNRELTTQLLGFENMSVNSVYAQMGRGKTEKILAFALSSLAGTLAKWAMDSCLFMSQNFGFITLPDQFTTGSSIMPHKKNPDVFELLRAKCNRIQSSANEVNTIINNLPSGYFRDYQLIKESIFPAIHEMKECLKMSLFISEKINVNASILDDEKYSYLFSVETVNKLVQQGTPFREAYKIIGEQIQSGAYTPDKDIKHTHVGSVGNPGNDIIRKKFETILEEFNFEKTEQALKKLIQ